MIRHASVLFSQSLRLVVLVLLFWMTGFPTTQQVRGEHLAGISAQDEAELVTHLQILSRESNSQSSDICTQILSKPEYDPSDWQDFFTRYFQQYPFTEKLFEYLTWPTFWAAPVEAQLDLQEAIGGVLRSKIREITQTHGDNLGQALLRSWHHRVTLAYAHRWQMYTTIHGKLPQEQKQAIFNFYIQHVQDWPHFYRKSVTIDIIHQPYIAGLAAQIHAILRELISNQDGNRATVAQTLNLQGRYLDLWNHFNLSIYDNNSFGQAELNLIYNYYNALPRYLRKTRGISQMEYIGNYDIYWLPIWLPGVNVFGIRIGEYRENPFPSDFPARECDVFLEVVAHEMNHPIFAEYIEKNPERNNAFLRLIQQAGDEPMHYLRSMFDPGFFVQNRQELFSSIANQYFCSSEETFKLGLQRFHQGIPYPLDQAFYFADIYSLGGSETMIYSTDLQAKIWKKSVPVYRDGQGRITGIQLPSGAIYVQRDNTGKIVEVGNGPPAIQAPAGLQVSLMAGETTTRTIKIKNSGAISLSGRFTVEGSQPNSVLELMGNAGVRVENNDSLNFRDNITIEAWVYPNTWEDDWMNNGRILQKGHSDDQYRFTVENGGLVFDLMAVGSVSFPYWTPPLNTWTHLAAVYDGQQMRIYINGVQKAETNASAALAISSSPLYIGNKDERLVDSFIGLMDNVMLWSTARSESQIRSDMQVTPSTGTPGLVGLWKFDGQDTTVEDRSGRGNHGILEGSGKQTEANGPVDWLMVEPTAVTMLPGQSVDVTVRVSTAELATGSYQAAIRIDSNDPATPVWRIPVQLNVSQANIEGQRTFLPLIQR